MNCLCDSIACHTCCSLSFSIYHTHTHARTHTHTHTHTQSWWEEHEVQALISLFLPVLCWQGLIIVAWNKWTKSQTSMNGSHQSSTHTAHTLARMCAHTHAHAGTHTQIGLVLKIKASATEKVASPNSETKTKSVNVELEGKLWIHSLHFSTPFCPFVWVFTLQVICGGKMRHQIHSVHILTFKQVLILNQWK